MGAKTLEIQFITDIDITSYANLSHTSGTDEVSYQGLVWINILQALSRFFDRNTSRLHKLRGVQDLKLKWIIIDTCCKKSLSGGSWFHVT